MNRRQFYFCILIFVPALLFLLRPADVSDLSIWTAIGRDSILQRHLLFNDIYSVLPTTAAPFPLMLCLLYGAVWLIGGVSLVAASHVVIPMIWSWLWLRDASRSFTSALWVFALAIAGTAMVYVPRPALVASLPLLVSYLVLGRNLRASSSRDLRARAGGELRAIAGSGLWWLVPVEIVWVNLHGSFLILPAMVAWAAVTMKRRELWALLVALLAAACVNPFGWKVYEYIQTTARISVARGFEEWAPTWNSIFPVEALFFAVCSVALLASIVRRRAWSVFRDPYWIVWLSACFVIRNVYMPFLLLPPFVLRNWLGLRAVGRVTAGDSSDGDEAMNRAGNEALNARLSSNATVSANALDEKPKLVNAVIVAAVCLAICALLPPARLFGGPFLSSRTHLEKINEYLRAHPGAVFNQWIYGSDLALEQPNKIYADSRNIIFSDEAFADYMRFMNEPASGFEALRRYDFTYFLIANNEVRAQAWMNERYPVMARDEGAVLYSVIVPSSGK